MSLKSWLLLYSGSRRGWIAAFSATTVVLVLLLHYLGGPPPLRGLTVIDGTVEQVRVGSILDSSYAVRLSLRGQDQKLTETQYFVNKGDSTGELLKHLGGQQVRAWIEPDYNRSIYQLEVNGRRIVDYDVRRVQITGNPIVVGIYVIVQSTVFLWLTLRLLKARRLKGNVGE